MELNRGIARLSDDVQSALGTYAAKASWPAGFAIYQRGAPADGLFVVVKGRVVLRSRVKAGRGFVPAIAGAGETFGAEGLERSGRYATDARADEPSETLHLSGARYRAFVREQPQQALALMAQVMAERTTLLDKLRELATLSVEERLVAAMLRMSQQRQFSEDGPLTLGASQYRLLCELVGATRESVSLVFNRFVSSGVVERDGTNYVVNDPDALAARLNTAWLDAETPINITREPINGDRASLR